jgi:hypothetical protein
MPTVGWDLEGVEQTASGFSVLFADSAVPESRLEVDISRAQAGTQIRLVLIG